MMYSPYSHIGKAAQLWFSSLKYEVWHEKKTPLKRWEWLILLTWIFTNYMDTHGAESPPVIWGLQFHINVELNEAVGLINMEMQQTCWKGLVCSKLQVT